MSSDLSASCWFGPDRRFAGTASLLVVFVICGEGGAPCSLFAHTCCPVGFRSILPALKFSKLPGPAFVLRRLPLSLFFPSWSPLTNLLPPPPPLKFRPLVPSTPMSDPLPSSPSSSPPSPSILSFFDRPLPPCFRVPILTATFVSSLLFLHNYRLAKVHSRTLKHAVDVSTFGFLGTAGIAWKWCVNERKERGEVVEKAMEKAGIRRG